MTRIRVFLLVLLAILISSCSKYGSVTLRYPNPPLAYLPNNINRIAIVNRSLTKLKDKPSSIIESITTAEIAGSDKLASDECLKGVFDRVKGRGQLTIVIPQNSHLFGTGTRQVPELLSWELVQKICDSTNAHALLVLETFDSNSDLLASVVTNGVNTVLNGGIPRPSLPSQIKINVISFWRLYNPSTKLIVDQYTSNRTMTFNGTGNNLMLPPPDALPRTAYSAGEEYIERFLPSYYRVRREMYKKGSGSASYQFKAAFRRAEVANWEDAIVVWKAIMDNKPSRKNAGRACVDIAVAYEVLGDTDQAIAWAKKSYEDYNNKLGRNYANILLDRKRIEH